jgi:hypothetical protein
VTTTKKPKIYRWCQRHRRLDSPAYISLPTPENEKYTKISSLGVMYTQLGSSQKMRKKIIPENFSLLSPVLLTLLNNIHSRLSLRIFEKNLNNPNSILRGQGDTDLRKKT